MAKTGRFEIVKVVRDGAMSSADFAEGRLVPCLILDCAIRQDVHDLIMIHQHQPPGDVISVWAKILGRKDVVYLGLEFLRPTPAKILIEFELSKHLMTVDGILETNAVMIQSSHFGASVVQTFDKPKILAEVTSEGLPFNWDSICRKEFCSRLRKEGMSKRQAIDAAGKAISESRKLWRTRHIPPRPKSASEK